MKKSNSKSDSKPAKTEEPLLHGVIAVANRGFIYLCMLVAPGMIALRWIFVRVSGYDTQVIIAGVSVPASYVIKVTAIACAVIFALNKICDVVYAKWRARVYAEIRECNPQLTDNQVDEATAMVACTVMFRIMCIAGVALVVVLIVWKILHVSLGVLML